MLRYEIIENKTGMATEVAMPAALSEIPLGKFVKYMETVELSKPDTMTTMQSLKTDKEVQDYVSKLTQEDLLAWQQYRIKTVQYWTGISDQMMAGMPVDDVILMAKMFEVMITDINVDAGARSFKLNGEEYLYPPAMTNGYTDTKEYMRGSRVIDLIEALQFDSYSEQLGKSKWPALLSIIAILCKKKDEDLPLDSAERSRWISQRAKIMEDLPTSEALNVAFFLLRQKHI